jgi:hypothetical protein
MRKLFMMLTLTIAYLGVAGAMSATNPPACDPCPWVR